MLKSSVQYIIVICLLIAAIILYNKQLGSIPLLLLSVYLFFIGIKQLRAIKKRNRNCSIQGDSLYIMVIMKMLCS